MELKEIATITGKPGLYKIISNTARGVIVESLDDKKIRFPVNGRQQMATLDEITIFTPDDENIPLRKILENIKEQQANGAVVPSHDADPVSIRDFFAIIAPGYDTQRVYPSNMKKILKWYELLDAVKVSEENSSAGEENKESEENS